MSTEYGLHNYKLITYILGTAKLVDEVQNKWFYIIFGVLCYSLACSTELNGHKYVLKERFQVHKPKQRIARELT